jgi:hypothetical protein
MLTEPHVRTTLGLCALLTKAQVQRWRIANSRVVTELRLALAQRCTHVHRRPLAGLARHWQCISPDATYGTVFCCDPSTLPRGEPSRAKTFVVMNNIKNFCCNEQH